MGSRKKKSVNKHYMGQAAGAVLVILLLAAISASLWVPASPIEMDPVSRLQPPSAEHWFGTDHFGRDIFSRIIYAAQVSLRIGLVTAILTTILGTITGLVTGYYRKADNVLMRIVDGVSAFPSFLLAIALVAALGGNEMNLVIALVFAFWPIMTRVVRSSTLQLSKLQYVEAARAVGTRDIAILFQHILPNALTPIIVQATFIFAEAILAEAALSFLGLGIKPPTPTWGSMLGESRIYLVKAPWFSIFPGIAIVLTVLSLNLFGDMLRDLLNPHTARKRKTAKSKVEGKEEPPNSLSVNYKA
ncbi:ABC transporter permease [Brevibacillus centrosporus]|uniref:Peptide/nickel transport system permease protein n=1 Tax=Brevibacillus centrosporus TaxID=54910 RepID=A0A1I3S4X9_9BACL|nr:ABC transporter permease [Brevibacillus centrosporus]MED4909261.1 ABC transporter permease [Brevibacillus centrosporus]SFJ53688.1 peptide/nickel transport system permease protein [Brevibacillus centrosporus]